MGESGSGRLVMRWKAPREESTDPPCIASRFKRRDTDTQTGRHSVLANVPKDPN